MHQVLPYLFQTFWRRRRGREAEDDSCSGQEIAWRQADIAAMFVTFLRDQYDNLTWLSISGGFRYRRRFLSPYPILRYWHYLDRPDLFAA